MRDRSGPVRPQLPKAPSGISGLDEVTGGGLPRGRATLVSGPAGCGKTLLAMEFLVRGITELGEPGVFLAFEESADDLVANVASMGFDLARYETEGTLVVDHVELTGPAQEATGDWDLDGLFIRLGGAIDEVGARRVAIDTIDTLFGAFTDQATLRAELRRLFRWLKDRGVTTVITCERGEGTLTRFAVEEYVSDCVIVLDHRVTEQTSTRRLRIVKYRGSLHGTDEYPFLIGESGLSVLPTTAPGLLHAVSTERVSSGVERLDSMLGGGGFFRGSTILVTGAAGTGTSTLAATFCDAACARGERALYVAYAGSEAEIVRNMASVGMDLARWVDAGLLRIRCFRPSLLGLEAHLFVMQNAVIEHDPAVVALDPVSGFLRSSNGTEVSQMVTRQVDFLKDRGITALFTSLDDHHADRSDQHLASLVDSWLVVEVVEGNGEHNRVLHVRKSRGMAHANEIRELLLTEHGVELVDVHVGADGMVTGSARRAREAQERAGGVALLEDLDRRRADLARRRELVEAQTAELWRELEAETAIVDRLVRQASDRAEDQGDQRIEPGRRRGAEGDEHPVEDPDPPGPSGETVEDVR